jgi:hypothetical protein
MSQPNSGYLSMTVDPLGVVRYAQHHHDVDLLKATFPDLDDVQCFALVDGLASLKVIDRKLHFTYNQVH